MLSSPPVQGETASWDAQKAVVVAKEALEWLVAVGPHHRLFLAFGKKEKKKEAGRSDT